MKTLRRTLALATLVGGWALAGPAAQAQPVLYGTTYLDNQLVSVDTTTGISTIVASLGTATNPFGLASYNNGLYTYDPNAGTVAQIDPATGANLRTIDVGVGALTGQGGLAINASGIGFVSSAFDNPTSLNLTNNLYEFNLATGATLMHTSTTDTLEALAFNGAGALYGLGKLDGDLYRIDTTTGAMTLVGNTGVMSGNPTGGLTFGANGTLYATIDDSLYTLNTTTGAATSVMDPATIGTLGGIGVNSISGLAFVNTAAVPEPSTVVLAGAASAAFAALAAGRKALRRRAS